MFGFFATGKHVLGAMSGQRRTNAAVKVGVPLYNNSMLDLDHCATMVPRNGNEIPLRVRGLWESRLIPYNAGLGIQTDIRRCYIDGVVVGDGVAPNFADGESWLAYAADEHGATVIDWSRTGYQVDPESGYTVKFGDPTRTLVGGAGTGGGRDIRLQLHDFRRVRDSLERDEWRCDLLCKQDDHHHRHARLQCGIRAGSPPCPDAG
jgi:hypothetical protein